MTGRATADDGTVIAFRQVGQGDFLLVVHGAAGDTRQWSRIVPHLAPRFTVVMMDRRGRGGSGPQRPGHSMANEQGDVVAVTGALGRPLHLLGHSSGARYALHAAPRIPDLDSLILYEPPASERLSDAIVDKLDRLRAAGDRRGILRTFLVDVVANDPDDVTALEQRSVWSIMMDNALTLPAELAAARSYQFDAADFADFRVPTLLLVGGDSGPGSRRVSDEVARSLADATVVTLAGQGHGAMASAPELMAAEIARFVDQLRA